MEQRLSIKIADLSIVEVDVYLIIHMLTIVVFFLTLLVICPLP